MFFDPNFRRVHYVRYADDFLVGTISSKAYAEQLKQEIKHFLESELHLRLSEEKTLITHAKKRKSTFSWLSHQQEISLTLTSSLTIKNSYTNYATMECAMPLDILLP